MLDLDASGKPTNLLHYGIHFSEPSCENCHICLDEKSKLLPILENVRLGWNWYTFCITELFTVVKSHRGHATVGSRLKISKLSNFLVIYWKHGACIVKLYKDAGQGKSMYALPAEHHRLSAFRPPPHLLVTCKHNIAESGMLREVHTLIYLDPSDAFNTSVS